MLPLYGKVWPNDSLRELVKRELQTLREAMAHGEIPFDQIVDACGVQRSPAHNPLVQALITTEEEGEGSSCVQSSQPLQATPAKDLLALERSCVPAVLVSLRRHLPKRLLASSRSCPRLAGFLPVLKLDGLEPTQVSYYHHEGSKMDMNLAFFPHGDAYTIGIGEMAWRCLPAACRDQGGATLPSHQSFCRPS